jgi:hypothetical protein
MNWMPATTISGIAASLSLTVALVVVSGDANACDKVRIHEYLLRHSPRNWETKLEFIRENRDFRGCDFSFRYRYDVDLYFSVKMTFEHEVRFWEGKNVICLESREVASAKREGLTAGQFRTSYAPTAVKACIAASKPKKPARGRLLDLFKN